MKKILYFFFILFLFSCKEETIEPNINFESPFVIKADPNNPVNQKRFELYKEYGVSVFFSDTVNMVYVNKNVYGDSVFKYEFLDLNWKFNSVSDFKYDFKYFSSQEDRLHALANVEKYLQSSIPALRPLSMLLVDDFSFNGTATDIISYREGNNTVKSLNSYRTLVMSNLHKSYSEDYWPNLVVNLAKPQIKAAVTRESLKAKLLSFQTISQSTHYNQYWATLDLVGVPTTNFTSTIWNQFNPTNPSHWTDPRYVAFRQVFGAYGFIGVSNTIGFWYSPTLEADQNHYIDALLNYNQTVFERNWEANPLVMEKYAVMRDIIVNELNIPLDQLVK